MDKRFLMLAFSVILIAGCSNDSGPYGNHKVSWYTTHIKADNAELKWCSNDFKRQKLNSCRDAGSAYGKIVADSWARQAKELQQQSQKNYIPKGVRERLKALFEKSE